MVRPRSHKTSITTQQITLNLRFVGQYEDAETGTYYNYFRDYNPDTGRYLTSDPIGLKAGVNTYAYALGNPMGLADPLGLESVIPYIQNLGLPGKVLDWGNNEFKPNPERFSDPLTEMEEAWFDYFARIYPQMVTNGTTWLPQRIDPDALTKEQDAEASKKFSGCSYKESYANFHNRRAIINAYIINHPAYQRVFRGSWAPMTVINPAALGYDVWHTISEGEDVATGNPKNPFWGVVEVASIYVGGKLIQYSYNRIVRAAGVKPSNAAIDQAWQQQLPDKVGAPGNANSGAGSLTNAARLRNQLASQEIAGGHAFDKHVLGIDNPHGAEFTALGIRTRQQFAEHIESVMNNPTHTGTLRNNRSYFYDQNTNTIVIRNPNAVDGGTAFRIDTNRYPNPLDYLRTLR